MGKIIFVSHCILNTLSKVEHLGKKHNNPEDDLRKTFLQLAMKEDIQIVQLPCPEFTLYGSKRWGHCKDQFDNPFFRQHCQQLLTPFILQMKEYHSQDRFEILGIIGVEGSPSCGVTRTYRGEWGGEFSGHPDIHQLLSTIRKEEGMGVFMEVLRDHLLEHQLPFPIVPLSYAEPTLCLDLIQEGVS